MLNRWYWSLSIVHHTQNRKILLKITSHFLILYNRSNLSRYYYRAINLCSEIWDSIEEKHIRWEKSICTKFVWWDVGIETKQTVVIYLIYYELMQKAKQFLWLCVSKWRKLVIITLFLQSVGRDPAEEQSVTTGIHLLFQ